MAVLKSTVVKSENLIAAIEGGIAYLLSDSTVSRYEMLVYGEWIPVLCVGWQCCGGIVGEEEIKEILEKAKEYGVFEVVARKVGSTLGGLPAKDMEDLFKGEDESWMGSWRCRKKRM